MISRNEAKMNRVRISGDSPVDNAVSYVVNSLSKPSFSGDSKVLLGNLVYYVPRVRSSSKLKKLVHSIICSKIWDSALKGDFLTLHESIEMIFLWKLEISEPCVSITEFYDIWDNAIKCCGRWSFAQITILGAIIKTKSKFSQLQASFFLDDVGSVTRQYHDWKYHYFLPLWRNLFLRSPVSSQVSKQLTLMLAFVFEAEDSRLLPCDPLCSVLLGLSVDFIKNAATCESFTSRNIGTIAKTLEVLLPFASQSIVSQSICSICSAAFELSLKEMNAPKPFYSSQTYSNQILTLVLTLRGSVSRRNVPSLWYRQVIMALFYVNFILQDFGRVGFESYEFLYDVCTTGVIMAPNEYVHCLEIMRSNLWNFVINNPVNDSRAVFLLEFMESTLAHIPLDERVLRDIIIPAIVHFTKSPNAAICEAAHTARLSLYSNHVSGPHLQKWKIENCKEYLHLSTDQFLSGMLSARQLIHIHLLVVRQTRFLLQYTNDLLREILHSTYLRALNCKTKGSKVMATLIECLIVQLPYVSEKHVLDWLDNCLELANSCTQERDQLLDKIWLQLTTNNLTDQAFDWWYMHVAPMPSKL